MSNLIREQRVDKNGTVNTKLVRATAAAPGRRSMPAPKASATASPRLPKGSGSYFPLLYKNVSPQIAAIPASEKIMPTLVIPDTTMYELCSFVSFEDALALFNRGIKSKSAATKEFKKYGVTGVTLDRGALMKKAQEAGIKAAVFCESVRKHPPEGKNVQDYIDGAVLNGIKAAREAKLDVAVMEGRASFSDIKTIGVTRMTKRNDDANIMKALEALKAGTVPYDAEGFKRLLERNQPHLGRAISLAERYGADFVCGLGNASDSWNIHLHLEKIGYDTSHEKDIILYGDVLNRQAKVRENEKGLQRRPYVVDDIPVLYESGIDAGTVAARLNEGHSVNQVVAHLQHDVPLSVSEGWL